MRYRSISLNDNESSSFGYSLVKYDERYKKQLERLSSMNERLAHSVEECPQIFSEESDYQSYMIFCDRDTCVGAVDIGTSTDEKNLEVEIQFIEEYFSSKEEMLKVLEQIVESLKLYFSDKENIEIKFNNDIDLSVFNGDKYRRIVYDEFNTVYVCSNAKNNELFSKLFDEINGAEETLTEWRQFWSQSLKLADINRDLRRPFDDKLLDEFKNSTIPLSEVFYKMESLIWEDIKSKKSTRNITFSRDGSVEFLKSSKSWEGISYRFKYNVLSDEFVMTYYKKFNTDPLEIDDNQLFTNIKSAQLSMLYSKENRRKKVSYVTPVVDNSSIAVELWIDDEEGIMRCYIDFRTHKSNGKINGLYALRIAPHSCWNKFSIRFISRDGDLGHDFSKEILQGEELYSSIIDGKLTIEQIDALVQKIIPIINNRAIHNKRQTISLENGTSISSLATTEEQAIDFIKQIKGEIPLPHLQASVEKFVLKNDKSKKNDKKITMN